MINKCCVNKDDIGKRAKMSRKKAIEAILLDAKTKDNTVCSIVNSVNQQDRDFIYINNKILQSPMKFDEIYSLLGCYKKGIVPVIIALIIKKNLDYAVVQEGIEEVEITADLFEKIDDNPSAYFLRVAEKSDLYEGYKSIFNLQNKSMSIFLNIFGGMQQWFFGLSDYARDISKKYIGKGKYIRVSEDTIRFKNSLRGIQSNVFWYISENFQDILGNDPVNELNKLKDDIDNTLEDLKITLKKDILEVFSGEPQKWYGNLDECVKNKIFNNNENYFLKIFATECDIEQNIGEIAKYLTGLSIENWSDNTPACFYDAILNIKNVIEKNQDKKVKNGYIINRILDDDKKFQRSLDNSFTIDKQIRCMLIRDIKALLAEYGRSIPYSAKLCIVLDMIMDEIY